MWRHCMYWHSFVMHVFNKYMYLGYRYCISILFLIIALNILYRNNSLYILFFDGVNTIYLNKQYIYNEYSTQICHYFFLCQTVQSAWDKKMCIIIPLYKRHIYTLWIRTCRHEGKYKVITIRKDLTYGGLNKIKSFCRWHLQMYKFDWNFA